MRIWLLLFLLIATLSSGAQETLPVNHFNTAYKNVGDSSLSFVNKVNKKWFFTSYSGVGLNFIAYRGGSATVVDVPMRLQLNRRLNNNLYAFAGVTAAPAYINFNRAFLSPVNNKLNSANGINSNSLGLYSRADLGLMYINDARTFSISGSIGVERSNSPIFLYQQRGGVGSSPFMMPNR